MMMIISKDTEFDFTTVWPEGPYNFVVKIDPGFYDSETFYKIDRDLQDSHAGFRRLRTSEDGTYYRIYRADILFFFLYRKSPLDREQKDVSIKAYADGYTRGVEIFEKDYSITFFQTDKANYIDRLKSMVSALRGRIDGYISEKNTVCDFVRFKSVFCSMLKNEGYAAALLYEGEEMLSKISPESRKRKTGKVSPRKFSGHPGVREYKQHLIDTMANVYDRHTAPPIEKGKSFKTTDEIAIFHVYEDTPITRHNAGSYIEGKSSYKLYLRFNHFKDRTKRLSPETSGKTLDNKIKKFERVMPFLSDGDIRQRASDEIQILKQTLKKEWPNFGVALPRKK